MSQGTSVSMDRRGFLQAAAIGWLGSAALPVTRTNMQVRKPRAVLFDALPIFDPRMAATVAATLYGDKAVMLLQAWRTRQFEYQWLRVLGNRYVDFLAATEDSLTFAARQSGIELRSEHRKQLMQAYTDLQIWPDTAQILPRISSLGVSLGILSNMTSPVLESGLQRAGLRRWFSHVLSTDVIRSYKPAGLAYQLGVDALGLKKEEILFVAFAGWDVAGAAWFGYPVYWLNRLASQAEELSAPAAGSGNDLLSLLHFLEQQAA